MRSTLRAFVPLILLAALACATVHVTHDYDPAIDFSKYRSYTWLLDPPGPTGRPRLDSPLVQERIRKAIDEGLARKGYTQAAQSPDFLVRYDLTAQSKIDVMTYDTGFYGRYGYRVGFPETTVRQYDEGSLIIDVVDDHAKKVVWRGIAQGRLRGANTPPDPAEMQERIDEVVNEVLAKFPPQKK